MSNNKGYTITVHRKWGHGQDDSSYSHQFDDYATVSERMDKIVTDIAMFASIISWHHATIEIRNNLTGNREKLLVISSS